MSRPLEAAVNKLAEATLRPVYKRHRFSKKVDVAQRCFDEATFKVKRSFRDQVYLDLCPFSSDERTCFTRKKGITNRRFNAILSKLPQGPYRVLRDRFSVRTHEMKFWLYLSANSLCAFVSGLDQPIATVGRDLPKVKRLLYMTLELLEPGGINASTLYESLKHRFGYLLRKLSKPRGFARKALIKPPCISPVGPALPPGDAELCGHWFYTFGHGVQRKKQNRHPVGCA